MNRKKFTPRQYHLLANLGFAVMGDSSFARAIAAGVSDTITVHRARARNMDGSEINIFADSADKLCGLARQHIHATEARPGAIQGYYRRSRR